jgi:bacillithiol system protein YtxJ
MMKSDRCVVLSNNADLEALWAESFKRPVVILKHSEWCNRSRTAIEVARRELNTWAKQIGCRIVIVQQDRELSDAIARRLDIDHETPQVIVIRNGRATWDASHGAITAVAVQHALDLAAAADASQPN